MKFSTINNFDLIRLFAASQVAIVHAAEHLNFESHWVGWLSILPGVPIFFFVSGFLIYGSYEKSLDDAHPLKNFYIKRFLRLYPALWLCIALSALILLFSGYLSSVEFSALEFGSWVATGATFFQFYNPEFLRGFGIGVINGSLWTIAVELQFYFLTPFLFLLLRRSNAVVIAVLIVFFLLNGYNAYFNPRETIIGKLYTVSFLPWFYMFMLGAITYKYKKVFDYIEKTSLLLLVVAYVVVWYVSDLMQLRWGNDIHLIGYLVLVAMVIKFAITKPTASDKLLRRNDISYGLYIFHMPLINLLLEKEILGFGGWALALIATLFVAMASWFLVERPMLRLKKRQLRSN